MFTSYLAQCPPPSLPPNTMVLTTLTTTVPPGTNITIGCVGGYYTDREEILICGSDGQWRGNITQCTGMNHVINTNRKHTYRCNMQHRCMCGHYVKIGQMFTSTCLYRLLAWVM